jgi:hypothetical protein
MSRDSRESDTPASDINARVAQARAALAESDRRHATGYTVSSVYNPDPMYLRAALEALDAAEAEVARLHRLLDRFSESPEDVADVCTVCGWTRPCACRVGPDAPFLDEARSPRSEEKLR